MFRSLHEVILPNEDFVGVYPTHGAGSLCSSGIAATPSSTIGYERRYNPMVQPSDVDAFAERLLSGQPSFPRYFARMRPINQAGPPPIGSVPAPRPLALEEMQAAIAGGALVVDARSPLEHAAAHIPGSYSVPAGSSFGTWLGWVVEPDRPIVLVLTSADDWDDLERSQSIIVGSPDTVHRRILDIIEHAKAGHLLIQFHLALVNDVKGPFRLFRFHHYLTRLEQTFSHE